MKDPSKTKCCQEVRCRSAADHLAYSPLLSPASLCSPTASQLLQREGAQALARRARPNCFELTIRASKANQMNVQKSFFLLPAGRSTLAASRAAKRIASTPAREAKVVTVKSSGGGGGGAATIFAELSCNCSELYESSCESERSGGGEERESGQRVESFEAGEERELYQSDALPTRMQRVFERVVCSWDHSTPLHSCRSVDIAEAPNSS